MRLKQKLIMLVLIPVVVLGFGVGFFHLYRLRTRWCGL